MTDDKRALNAMRQAVARIRRIQEVEKEAGEEAVSEQERTAPTTPSGRGG